MARQLTPLGRVLVVLAGLSLLGLRPLQVRRARPALGGIVAPDKKAEGTVSRDDFAQPGGGEAPAPGGAAATARPPRPRAARGSNRPIKVAIVLWGGYAGGIMANGGMAPNPDSVVLQGLRRAGGAAPDRRLHQVARRLPRGRRPRRRGHHVVHGRRLRPGVRRPGLAQPQGHHAVRLEPRRRRHRRGRLHQERARPARARSWPARRPRPRTTSRSTC